MRIVLYSRPFYPDMSGVPSTTRSMARVLTALGHDVSVYTETPLGDAPELDDGYAIVRSTHWPTLRRLIGRHDLLISKGGLSGKACLAAVTVGTPYWIVHEMSGPLLAGPWRQRLIRGPLARRARLHVGVSSFCLSSKQLDPAWPQAVLYNAINPDLEADPPPEPLPEDRRTVDVLFVGGINADKGVPVLMKALERLDREGRAIHAKLVGMPWGDMVERVREQATAFTHVRVDLPGPQRGQALVDCFREARLFAMPTVFQGEAMGCVIAEAMYFGLPVLASDQPAAAETLGDGGLVTPQHDEAALADAIRSVLDDPDLRARLQRRALARRGMFTHDAYQQNVARLIEQYG